MAELVALAIGALLFGLGSWILLLRVSGFYDLVHPHNMSIGRMTVDGSEDKVSSELLRARFDHHFRRPTAISTDTGFLEAATLDTPELFQPQGVEGGLQAMTLEVSGVDVTSIVKFVNKLAAPDEWVVEGDFQVRSDRALLALRLRRGARVIRTWYLERFKTATEVKADESSAKALLLEKLIDDAIFQLVYDFINPTEQDRDLRKWRDVIRNPPPFPSPAAVGAFYEAQGALGRYYTRGDFRDLDVAVEHLRKLQGQMPEFANGLRLLGMALTEKRAENEAIHVYEQLELLLERRLVSRRTQVKPEDARRLMHVQLQKATVKSKLNTWASAHEAVGELTQLAGRIQAELGKQAALPEKERAAYGELLSQTAAQLAYTYALYLDYLSHSAVATAFGDERAPKELKVDANAIKALGPDSPPEVAMRIVREKMGTVASQYREWLEKGYEQKEALEHKGPDGRALWDELEDKERRRTELVLRLHLASGYANYRMAEWERPGLAKEDSLFGETFETRLESAKQELLAADAAHPNHYALLQLLGLAHSEPRDKAANLSLAEQYFERAAHAKPADYAGQEMLAAILLRRIHDRGVDLSSRPAILQGLATLEKVIEQTETSGAAHLLRAQFQTLLLEVERDGTRRQELRDALQQYLAQAARFLPKALGMEEPELTWLRVTDAARQFEERAAALAAPHKTTADERKRFDDSKAELLSEARTLIGNCKVLEDRWVNQRRVFEIQRIRKAADDLIEKIETDTVRA